MSFKRKPPLTYEAAGPVAQFIFKFQNRSNENLLVSSSAPPPSSDPVAQGSTLSSDSVAYTAPSIQISCLTFTLDIRKLISHCTQAGAELLKADLHCI